MKKIVYIALLLVIFTACGRTPKQARQELGKLGIDYNEWSCFESTRKQDKLAVELFLDIAEKTKAMEMRLYTSPYLITI